MSSNATLKTFEFIHPVEYRNGTYTQLVVRRPRVKDLKNFVKNAEQDSVAALEKVIADLSDGIDEKVISEIDLEDFAPIKKWFEGFLKVISDASAN